MKICMLAGLAAVGLLAASATSAAPLTNLVGDKDCFGTGGACVEDGVTWIAGWGFVTQGPGDPAFMDREFANGETAVWSHSFAPGSYTGGSLSFRTAGIADILGPYDVFADGFKVGAMPKDGYGHILAETFTFAIPDALLSDGSLTVSFTSTFGDSWAVDYSELTAVTGVTGVVPVPAAGLLLLSGLASLGLLRRRTAA